jgi:hypothetical protein
MNKRGVVRNVFLYAAGFLALAAFAGTLRIAECRADEQPKMDNIKLMAEAERIVHEKYPDTLLVETDGLPSSGSAQHAKDVDQWRFIFVYLEKRASIEIWYRGAKFEKPIYHDEPFFGVMFEPLPRHMTLERAIKLAHEAGHTDAFRAVSLFEPVFPATTEAQYAFTIPEKPYIFVGAVSGRVSTSAKASRVR